MNIYFRTDGNTNIGIGHIMRCLTLASELKKNGAAITFICNNSSKNLANIITSRGIDVQFIPEEFSSDAESTLKIIKNADWLIIDHYAIDSRWEKILRPAVKNIMIIDDLANRSHDCDLLLDQNFYPNSDVRYKNLVPKECTQLLGPSYALLREEFLETKPSAFNAIVKNILISFGGSDPDNFTGKVLKILSETEYRHIAVDIVTGEANKHIQAIQELCKKHPNFNFHCQIDYMAKLMATADLFIGAGGSTSWERLAMGLPSVVIAIAENQVELCSALAEKDLIKYCGISFDQESFKSILNDAIADKIWRKEISSKGKEIVDGRGAAKVAQAMLNITEIGTLVLLSLADSQMVLNWRNGDDVRKWMTNSDIINQEQHDIWLNKILASKHDMYFIYKENNKPVGVVCFNNIDKEKKEADWGFYIGEKDTAKGTGTRMCLKAISYAFDTIELKTIHADVFKNNLVSIKLHLKLGFKERNPEKNEDKNKMYFIQNIVDQVII